MKVRDLWTHGDATYDVPKERWEIEKSLYRYMLSRELVRSLHGSGETVVFVLLNPSTATHLDDDNTIRRCISFAHGWGRLVIVNLFAWRETKSKLLLRAPDPEGDPANVIEIVGQASRADLVVCAWGKMGSLRGRGAQIEAKLRKSKCDPHYLRLLDDGMPEHPLYLPRSLQPQRWNV